MPQLETKSTRAVAQQKWAEEERLAARCTASVSWSDVVPMNVDFQMYRGDSGPEQDVIDFGS